MQPLKTQFFRVNGHRLSNPAALVASYYKFSPISHISDALTLDIYCLAEDLFPTGQALIVKGTTFPACRVPRFELRTCTTAKPARIAICVYRSPCNGLLSDKPL